ncbi:hypothetical protein POTOM_047393 [Populus tomentosa]|uniref:Retrovirus-related Pol polyprotein from transposon TNT 1-94-like beta-barrel domain-containing protein n=1 Tax=Populus tomentosa TaxID=118781 RepID=A0A8X8CCH0_POPTO|nr:hypothetical protein POTOM_047393 [Populus tomentosa]
MAEEKGAGSQDALATTPIMAQIENSSFNIGMVLDEKNYDLWAPLIQIYIAGRKKMGYLHGSIEAPHEDDHKYDDWFSKDQKIKSWLLSSMKPEIMKRYIRLSTSKEIWDSLKTSYFDENDEARINLLNQKASHLHHNSRPLATYFGELTEIFQELDHFNRVSMKFDQVCGEVLQKDPPLGLQASFAYVHREADRKEAMKMEVDKRHSKSHYFELIGYPKNWDKTRDPRCNKSRASIVETKNDSNEIADKAFAMVATTGRDGKALSTSTSVMNNTWIIDSGATEHMTCDSRQILSLKTSAHTEVNVANGNAIPVIGEGTISLTDTMKLDTVHMVPSLNYNLLPSTSSLQEKYRSSEVLTRDNTEVLTFDYSPVARNELHEEQPVQSSHPEYTLPGEEQQSTCYGDQATKKIIEEQQTFLGEEQSTGPTRLGLDNELQPTTYNRTEQ